MLEQKLPEALFRDIQDLDREWTNVCQEACLVFPVPVWGALPLTAKDIHVRVRRIWTRSASVMQSIFDWSRRSCN